MSSWEEEGRNQGMMGNRLTLPQVVEGEGSQLGRRHETKTYIKHFPFFSYSQTVKSLEEQTLHE